MQHFRFPLESQAPPAIWVISSRDKLPNWVIFGDDGLARIFSNISEKYWEIDISDETSFQMLIAN